MKIVALAACVAAAVAVSFFMQANVPPWTVVVWVPLFVISFLLGRRTASWWPASVFAAGVLGGLMGLFLVGLAVALPWFLGRVGHQQAALAAAGVEAAHLRERHCPGPCQTACRLWHARVQGAIPFPRSSWPRRCSPRGAVSGP